MAQPAAHQEGAQAQGEAQPLERLPTSVAMPEGGRARNPTNLPSGSLTHRRRRCSARPHRHQTPWPPYPHAQPRPPAPR
jgi:hypothetical protein